MSDELTPDEKAAFDSLPRERMPVGLEARVVDAMRDHGFLAKRRRTIVLTNNRVAGVLAAGVALIIGAYSIGLHRGDGEEALRTMVQHAPTAAPPVKYTELGDPQSPPSDAATPEADRLEAQDALQEGALQKERSRANEAQETIDADAPEEFATAPPASVDESKDESKKDLDWQLTPKEEERSDAPKSAASRLAPSAGSGTDRVLAMDAAPEATQPSRAFLLNGKKVFVEAPDSVRIVEDEQGRVLLIYTSDGIIRIRLAD